MRTTRFKIKKRDHASNIKPTSYSLTTRFSFDVYGDMLVDTVDGRNPAPVEVGSLSHYLQCLYIPGGCLGFLPSTVPPSIRYNLFPNRHVCITRLRFAGCFSSPGSSDTSSLLSYSYRSGIDSKKAEHHSSLICFFVNGYGQV